MRRYLIFEVLLVFLLVLQLSIQAKKQKTLVVTNIVDYKEFKKLLRTKTNVLVLYVNNPKETQALSEVFRKSAGAMKGQATLVMFDCSNSDIKKKICKKMKVGADKAYYIKHYKDGDFHKNYDRGENIASMTNFLRDPTGELPWEEDPQATVIYHLNDAEALTKLLKKTANKKLMVMFYAPWCGYCKIMKPEYVGAATDLKGQAVLAAIDVTKPGNSIIRQAYNITGFPTLLYFEKGQFRYTYDGENKRGPIVEFIKDPIANLHKKKEVVDESWSPDSDVVHLTADNFDNAISKSEHALVVFYAPWCGHCKKIKPEYEKAAAKVKAEEKDFLLAAVDATKESELASRFDVKGYPTLKYFSKGEFQYDAGHVRQEEQILKFVEEPQPPPPPEKPWSEEQSAVRHLDAATFRNTLRKIKHALVMFYAPWCGHCKSAKPEFVHAAEKFADELMVAFGAVDCTAHQKLCASYEVKAYPTIKYFSHYDKLIQDYTGGRKKADFVSFIHTQMAPTEQKAKSTPQQAGFGTNVVIADDSTFFTTIESTKPTFVMFYASWCGHCSTVKPAFSKLSTTFKEKGNPVQVIAIDAAENPKTADFAAIENLPTFKMFAAGKELKIYEGDRSYDDFVKFCQSYIKVKDEL